MSASVSSSAGASGKGSHLELHARGGAELATAGNVFLRKVRVSSLTPPTSLISPSCIHLTLLLPVQRQLGPYRTPHPSINYLLSRHARLPISFYHTQRPALIRSHPHPRLLQNFHVTQPLSCRNLSKPARQLEKQSALRRSANRSVFYRF